MATRIKLSNFIILAALIGVSTAVYHIWTEQDEAGRIPVSAVLTYDPPRREYAVEYNLGYDTHNERAKASGYGAAGAARVGQTVYFKATPLMGALGSISTTVKMYQAGKLVRTCPGVGMTMVFCDWTVS